MPPKRARSTTTIVQSFHAGDPGFGRKRNHTSTRGRPSNAWRAACRAALERARGLQVLERIISGDIYEPLTTTKHGEVIYGPTKNRDRLAAIALLSRLGYGLPNNNTTPEPDEDERGFVFLVHPMAETTEEWLTWHNLHQP